MEIYVVAAGDTINSIAGKFGVSADSIIANNSLDLSQPLVVGQTIVILRYAKTYTVQQGNTLTSIAATNGVTVNQLLRNNPVLAGLPNIYPGQTIVIEYDQQKQGELSTIGYTYPFIEQPTLRRTLPYLSFMTVFTYGFNPDGSLIIPDDAELLRIARGYGTSPIMLISTLNAEGVFSNELANILLSSEEIQNALINNIISVMQQKGYTGLDVDFEYIFASDATPYVNFIRNLTERLNAVGFTVYVSLAPKTSVNQPGLLYEGHNYAALGEAANFALLMTYEWGYTYGPPMAVAPIDKVREVVDFAVTQIPPKKLYMGIPNYGYDWPLPFVSGQTAADSISNVEAVSIAARTNSVIKYDETSQAPFFNYTENGVEHEVWFEDARSIRAKLALINEFGLYGASFWNIMHYFPQNWLVLNSLYNIRR